MPRLILVVDDHADTVEVYEEMLRDAGFRTYGTTSANDALNMALTKRPAVIVTDLAMPHLDGWELAALLRSYVETRAIRLVAVSGYTFDFDRYRVPPGGWDACLRKPVDLVTLVGTIHALLGDEETVARPRPYAVCP